MAKAKTATEKHQCCGEAWDGWRYCPCSSKGSLQEGGKWYCKRHAPSIVKARDEARNKRYREQSEARQRKWHEEQDREEHRDLCEAACSGVPTEHLKPGILAQALASLPRKVEGLPSEEGFYWYIGKIGYQNVQTIVEVVVSPLGNLMAHTADGERRYVYDLKGTWYGPLVPPQEQQT